MKKVPTGPTLPPSAVSNPGWILSGSPVDVPKPKGSDLTSGAGGSGSEGSVSPSPARRGGTGWIEAGVGGRPRRGRDRRGTMHRDGKVFAVARRSAVGTARGETRSRRRRGRGRVSGRTGTADDGGAARGEGDARGTGGGDDAQAASATPREDARATTRVAGRVTTMDDVADIVASSSRGAAATGRSRGPSRLPAAGEVSTARRRATQWRGVAPSRHLARLGANLLRHPRRFSPPRCLPRGC